MILIVTHKEDFTVDFVVDKLNKKGEAYFRLNCEDILSSPYSIGYSNIELRECFFVEKKFSSVWYRRTKLPNLNSHLDWAEKVYLWGEIDAFMKNIFGVLSASKWMSNPTAIYLAENKFLQLKIAREIGFMIPKTLITSSKNDILNFYRQNKGQVIVKPVSQTRLTKRNNSLFFFTSLVTEEMILSLDEWDITPCIFQEEIKKEYEIRITVVSKKVFAAAVFSQNDEITKLDWRKKRLAFFEIQLPNNIELLCIKLVEVLGLEFGAIDMIKTMSGEYVFLEINPNGQWAWVEKDTNMNISDSIIDFLIK